MTDPITPILPAFFNMRCTDKGDQFSSEFFLFLDQTFQVLNSRVTMFGLNVPAFTAAEIAAWTVTPVIGTIWFNKDLNALQFQGNTGIQTITST